VRDWLAAAAVTEGPLFRRVGKGGKVLSDRLAAQSVALIVKGYAARLGLAAAAFSGHSLRSGRNLLEYPCLAAKLAASSAASAGPLERP
jgi:hypothetical protein